jgi:hypothetical protein
MKLLAALALLLALTAPLAQARTLQQAGVSPPPLCNVNYGAFGRSVAFIMVRAAASVQFGVCERNVSLLAARCACAAVHLAPQPLIPIPTP